jgi:hypothetical protein
MKMNWILFLGLFVVLLGLSIVLNAVFRIDFPLVRTAFALFVVFLGLRILVHAWRAPRAGDAEGTSVLSASTFIPKHLPNGDLQYDVIFSSGLIDLRALPASERDVTVVVNSIFASSVVYVDPAIPYDVSGSAAFGEARMPNRSSVAFGETRYAPRAAATPKLHLKVNAVFGACEVVERTGLPSPSSGVVVPANPVG